MGSFLLSTMKDRLTRSAWCVVILALLVDTCTPALLHRRKRQDLGHMVHNFLQADDRAQIEYVRHGLDLLQQGVDNSLGELIERDQAQDRIFIASVQSLVSALQTILNDPSDTPSALASLATDPSNVLTLVTLVVATAFAAQISAFTLFGDPGSSSSRGIVGMILDFIVSLMEGMENEEGNMVESSNDMEDSEMNSEDANMEGEDDMSNGMEDEVEQGSGEEMENTEEMSEMMDEDMTEEENQGGIIEAVISFITGILNGNSDDTDDNMTEDGNGDMEDSEGSGMDDVKQEDSMINIESDGDGGSSFGGVSISLHPIDLAAMFVQVQEAIGMNCTCADGAMTEEMVTNATLRLIQTENIKKKKATKKTEKKKNKKNKKVKKNKGKRVPKLI